MYASDKRMPSRYQALEYITWKIIKAQKKTEGDVR